MASFPEAILAKQDQEKYVADRYGFALITGTTYDPDNDINFYMVSGFALYDYDKVWGHKAPEPLRFKIEFHMGLGRDAKTRFITSANIMALYFTETFSSTLLKPFIEAGIGLIYTDFRVKGQGLRFNFNPVLGIGTEFKCRSDNSYFITLRLHHISNGDLHEKNRGVNSALLLFGRFF